MQDTEQLLNKRQFTHGSFHLNAFHSQTLKRHFRTAELSDTHFEALDMIACKLSRILSGQANFKDHWDDIAGYATLAARECHEPPSR